MQHSSWFLASAWLALAACDGDPAEPVLPDAAPPTSSTVRVAHFAPDAPAVDFCFVPQSGPVIGPVLAGAGLVGGVSFGKLTPYLPVAAEVYSVRVIAAGTACSAPVFEYPNVAVPAGGFAVTAAAVGFLDPARGPGLDLVFWIDDNAPAPAGAVRLRTLHAAPGTPDIDLGVLAAGATVLGAVDVVGDNVTFKLQPVPPYRSIAPLKGATLRAQHAQAPTRGADLAGVDLPAGATATAFVLGATAALRVMVCVDSVGDGACAVRE
jgi:Domain of unknown function (DUF4397)